MAPSFLGWPRLYQFPWHSPVLPIAPRSCLVIEVLDQKVMKSPNWCNLIQHHCSLAPRKGRGPKFRAGTHTAGQGPTLQGKEEDTCQSNPDHPPHQHFFLFHSPFYQFLSLVPSAPPSGSPPCPKEQGVLKLPPRAWSLRSDARSSLLQESALEKGRGGEEGGLESQELGGAPTPPLPADQHQEPRWLYFSLGGGAADFHHVERSFLSHSWMWPWTL